MTGGEMFSRIHALIAPVMKRLLERDHAGRDGVNAPVRPAGAAGRKVYFYLNVELPTRNELVRAFTLDTENPMSPHVLHVIIDAVERDAEGYVQPPTYVLSAPILEADPTLGGVGAVRCTLLPDPRPAGSPPRIPATRE